MVTNKNNFNLHQCYQLPKHIPGNQISTYMLNHIHNGDLLIQTSNKHTINYKNTEKY